MGDLPLPMVSSSTGSIISILDKLTALEAQYPHLTEGVRESLKSLNDALHSFAGRRVRNSLDNEWMLQVRELVYDMEDWIDCCLIVGPSSKLQLEAEEFDVAEQMEDFKAQIQDAHERCTRYGLLLISTAPDPPAQDDDADNETSSKVAMDPKLLHGEVPCLVAMDAPRNTTLVKQLTDGEERRKVVCIVGTGGIGKTTLATEIYRQLQMQGRFSCWAFVRLGRRSPSVKTTLITILKQVLPEWYCEKDLWSGYNYDDLGAWDEKKVVAKLWASLKTKSYFIVLDDMRSMRTWKIISCALPNNDKFPNRILITTCTEDVAKSCCIHPNDVVHRMEGLDKNDSKTLFDSKRPHSEQNSLLETSDDTLEMCGGMPLAITVTAGLLSRNSACQLPHDQQCHSTLQGMRKILEMSYDDLPLPVKSCFLYLSAFPENCTIKKDRLIRRWGAEGLIAKRDRESLWETGESHFNELINRRLIQPAFDEDSDEPTGCTVHDVVFDFVESLSAEENFITEGAKLKCGLFPYNRVRRVCLDCGEEDEDDDAVFSSTYCYLKQKSHLVASSSSLSSDEEESSICAKDEAISLHLSQVRSLAFSGDVRRTPDLSVFKLVRVLDLSDSKGLENEQLGTIGSLSLLSYLGLGRSGGADDVVTTELPQQIMELEHLSTLDLRQAEVKNLPEFKSTKLVSLLVNGLKIAEGGIMGAMENLEELSTVCVGRDGSLAEDVAGLVARLTRLRMFGLRFSTSQNNVEEAERQGILHLVEAVGKSNLQFLFLDEYPHCLLRLLVDCWSRVRPRYLWKFELRLDWLLCPPRVPQEIRSLVDLTHLHIGVSTVDAQGLRALGELPKLVLLKLYSLHPPSIDGRTQRFSVSSKDGFQRLKVLWYFCEHGRSTGLQLEAGAMPQLRRLLLDFQASHKDFVLGIQHLSCLVQVRATIYLGPPPTSTTTTAAAAALATEAEAHIRDQVSENPNNPVLELNRKHQGRLLRRPGQQPSNVKLAAEESSVYAIHSLDEWSSKIEEAQSNNKLVVIQFTARWCRPSRVIAPFFAHLANKFTNAVFLKVDIDEMEDIAQQFRVTGAPIFLFMSGGEVKDRLKGAYKLELLEKLELQMALML